MNNSLRSHCVEVIQSITAFERIWLFGKSCRNTLLYEPSKIRHIMEDFAPSTSEAPGTGISSPTFVSDIARASTPAQARAEDRRAVSGHARRQNHPGVPVMRLLQRCQRWLASFSWDRVDHQQGQCD